VGLTRRGGEIGYFAFQVSHCSRRIEFGEKVRFNDLELITIPINHIIRGERQMKFQRIFCSVIIVAAIAILSISTICFSETSTDKTTMEEVKQEMQDVIQALKEYSIDQRDEAVKETKAALNRLDNRIDALETHIDNNWDTMNEAARKKTRTTLKSLRKQRTQMTEWYDSLKSSSAVAWEEIKKGFSDAYTSFYNAWEKSEKEVSSSK
jgi:hypothetical protein